MVKTWPEEFGYSVDEIEEFINSDKSFDDVLKIIQKHYKGKLNEIFLTTTPRNKEGFFYNLWKDEK